METEQTEDSSYLPATSPRWAEYYQEAKRRRRLGRGEHKRIQTETKRRRVRERIFILVSSVFLGGMVLGFYELLSR
jgi:hypothetical protein